MPKINKARYWVGVLYPENMLPNWQEEIDDILQLPYAYCIHDKDTDSEAEDRKVHLHLIVVFPNTTTYNHALSVFDLLSAEGKKAINTVESIINIRSKYEYLIHNTEKAKKSGKHLYSPEERILGNNFDIGAYEQISKKESNDIMAMIETIIIENGFSNFYDLTVCIKENFDNDTNVMEVFRAHQNYFAQITKGKYFKLTSPIYTPQKEEKAKSEFFGYGETIKLFDLSEQKKLTLQFNTTKIDVEIVKSFLTEELCIPIKNINCSYDNKLNEETDTETSIVISETEDVFYIAHVLQKNGFKIQFEKNDLPF